MEADVYPVTPNPCCAIWMKRIEKLEKSKDAFRKSLKILEGKIERQSIEIASLRRDGQEQQMQREQQKDEIMKVAIIKTIRKDLEKEIQHMKGELFSLERTKSSMIVVEDEIGMLKARILGGEEEVKILKGILEKERKKTVSERKKTEMAKKKAAKVCKLLKDEKRKAEELEFLVDSEKKKTQEFRLCLENIIIESNKVREKLSTNIAKVHDAKKQAEVEKLKVDSKGELADWGRLKVEQEVLIEEEIKKALNAKEHANDLCQLYSRDNLVSYNMGRTDGALEVVAENIDGSSGPKEMKKPCAKSSAYKAVDQVTDHSSKKRKVQTGAKSVSWLHSEDNELRKKIEDKISPICDPANSSAVFEDLDDENLCQKKWQNDLCVLHDHTMKVASADHQTERNTKENVQSPSKDTSNPSFIQATKPYFYQSVTTQATTSVVREKQMDLKSFEDIISGEGGCLKLLELDDPAEEERYKAAMEMPLSPILPVLEIPITQLDGELDSHALK